MREGPGLDGRCDQDQGQSGSIKCSLDRFAKPRGGAIDLQHMDLDGTARRIDATGQGGDQRSCRVLWQVANLDDPDSCPRKGLTMKMGDKWIVLVVALVGDSFSLPQPV